ncbi:MAG: UDP-N-acetylmuramoyl-L-alanine--D-glutamate ligase [Clostridia bacterium]|nr:UDP-N-acetylmuramoyl-L-alanine--D-glutamate ligase [Clostridia bacterium]
MAMTEWQKRLSGARCAVVGLGVSNLPLIDFLLAHGACVSGRDRKTRAELGETAETLERKGVRLILGDTYLDGFDEEILFRSPGLRPDHPSFLSAVERGATLTSEMELFFALCPATVIGITGSDGKTTTTTLTGLMLETECKKRGRGHVFVGGNIGTPLLSKVEDMTAEDFCVVELSSFQLQSMRQSPKRAAVTNVTPNHLDWHTDFEEYVNAKTNIFCHADNTLLVTNAENEITCKLAGKISQRRLLFSSQKSCPSEFGSLLREGDGAFYLSGGNIVQWDGEKETAVLSRKDILLPGLHNVENYMTAIALTEGLVSRESIWEVATTFTGVAHRLERIREKDGVIYYNSSIDSSPTRTAAALSALAPKRPIVICGGYDKKIPFEPLAEALCRHAKAVILTGATAEKIRKALDSHDEIRAGKLPVYSKADFTEAVCYAKRIAQSGDVVLLSPACASFDAFKNFAERGETFRRIVESF